MWTVGTVRLVIDRVDAELTLAVRLQNLAGLVCCKQLRRTWTNCSTDDDIMTTAMHGTLAEMDDD